MIDFNRLSRPKATAAPLDPAEIFAKTPNLNNAPNSLWTGQAEALKSWHCQRGNEDVAILLNTGAGKSIVGVLIAQSLVNEQIGPVVFACSTIDLVSQTARECDRLGIAYTKRVEGGFTNDLFETGKAFCITTYQALFASITTFTGEKKPAAVIFDDAHVAEHMIRDAFTIQISKKAFPRLHADIIDIVRPEFEKINKGDHFSYVLDDVGQQVVTMCPPATAFHCKEQIVQAIKRTPNLKQTAPLYFPFVHLMAHIRHCAIFVSSAAIEITPPFIPTGAFEFLGNGVRRVYLSATLEFETDFVRGFGRKSAVKIAPENDAGNGERLILLASRFKGPIAPKALATEILKKHKLPRTLAA
jgi:hypothetical protein